MVLPITDRTRYDNKYGAGYWERMDTQIGKAQAKPIDRVLPYYRNRAVVTSIKRDQISSDGASEISHISDAKLGPVKQALSNASYEKLRSKVKSADLGVNIVEYRQARDMFATRGLQLAEVLLLLSRRKFAAAGRVLKCSFYDGPPPRKRRDRKKWVLDDHAKHANISLSNLWLEWHFGLSPLIGDVQTVAEILTDPLPKTRLYGRSEEFVRETIETKDAANPGTVRTWKRTSRVRHQQGADVAITNPNLALAGQLGLLNPAALLWEIVPFSFVADWFVNVGDWLQGFTDFAGMTLAYSYSTSHVWTFYDHSQVLKPSGTSVVYTGHNRGSIVTVNRAVGLTAPILALRPLKLPSLSRAATIWSLGTQLVRKHEMGSTR